MTFGPEEFFENEDAKAGAGDTGTEAPTTGRRFKPTRFGQVVMNTETQARSMRNVAFLD